jgi:hypothetical protein
LPVQNGKADFTLTATASFQPDCTPPMTVVWVMGEPIGDEPVDVPRDGLGRAFSTGSPAPVLLDEPSAHGRLVEEFDELAEFYEILVRPFSTPIFDEALAFIRRHLAPSARVLDAGCGPGRELRRVAALVPDGEVVGVDLAAGMVEIAHAAARSRGLETARSSRQTSAACPPGSRARSTSSTAASRIITIRTPRRRRARSSAASAPAASTAWSTPARPGSTR